MRVSAGNAEWVGFGTGGEVWGIASAMFAKLSATLLRICAAVLSADLGKSTLAPSLCSIQVQRQTVSDVGRNETRILAEGSQTNS